MTELDNIKLVQQAYDSFKTGDIQTLLGTFADDVEWQTPEAENIPYGGKCHGREQVAQFFASLDENEEVLQFESREFIGQGDTVIALGLYEAKVKSTGRTYKLDWAHLFTVRNGKIENFHEYVDGFAGLAAYQKTMTASNPLV